MTVRKRRRRKRIDDELQAVAKEVAKTVVKEVMKEGTKPAVEAKEKSSLDAAKELITLISHDEQVAKSAGTITGANAVTLAVNTWRLINGELSEKEVFAYFQNLGGLYLGGKSAVEAWSDILEQVKLLPEVTLDSVMSTVIGALQDWGILPSGEAEKAREIAKRIKIDIEGES